MSTLRAQKIWDDWQEWLSEPCEKGTFEGKPYVNFADPCSNAGEAKLIELIEAALAEAALRAETPTPREALKKHRYGYAEIDLVAQCSCGWKYDAPVGRSNGWDWWAIHFKASLASDCAETEKAIRNLSWDESCNGKWTAVVRVEHVLAILRAAGEPEQAK